MVPSIAGNSPSLTVKNGNLVQIHLINEEKNESSMKSKHNLNIDEFNVHTGDLPDDNCRARNPPSSRRTR